MVQLESRLESVTAPTGAPARRRRPSVARRKSMWPREHGAYAQLGFPLLTAGIVGGPSWLALAWTLAVVLAFLAHEPLLVLLGQRGARQRRELAPRAWRWLTGLSMASLATLIAAIALAGASTRLAIFVSLTLAAPLGVFIWRKREKTGPGELLATLAFASAGAPIVLQGGAAVSSALTLVAAWAAIFAMGTLSVRGIIRRRRAGRLAMLPPLCAVVASWGAVAALALGGLLTPVAALALLPTGLFGLAVLIRPPHPRHLRALGFTLLGTSTLAAVLLCLALLGAG